jgi:copper(I)-binding protein
MRRRLPVLLGMAVGFGLLGVPLFSLAQTSMIQIDRAWSRAAAAGRGGVLYCTVTDSGTPDRLTGVSTPVADRAELHQSTRENGIAKMRAVDGLTVAPDKPLTLAPGGYHVMLMGLKQPLKPGDKFPVTFTFEHAGAVDTTAVVEKGGMTMPMH